MKKHISFYSELAQIISAIAVVISLIYVGVQIRQNTLTTQAAMRQSVADNDITYLMSYLDSAVIAEAIAKLSVSDTLTTKEKEQLKAQQQVNFRVFENAHYQYANKLLEEEVWYRYQTIIYRLLTTDEAAIEQWDKNSITYTKAFQNAIQQIISDETLSELIKSHN